MKCSCYVCKVEVKDSVEEHFTSYEGKILCDSCSIGVEPCSDRIKQMLMKE